LKARSKPVHGCRCDRRCESWALIGLSEARFEASRPLSLRTLITHRFAEGGRLHGQCVPCVAIGTGMPPENTDRICVFTIVITAPQHVHRIGGRSLTHASA